MPIDNRGFIAGTSFANDASLLAEIDRQREELRQLRLQHQQLTQQVISAQEKERQRIARELHDEAGQALTALKVSLEIIQSGLPMEADYAVESGLLRQRVGDALSLCQRTMEQIRGLAHSLHPAALDDLGLALALEGFCRDFAGHTQLSVIYQCSEIPVLCEAAELCLFRFVQEGLTNVVKHARASRVLVSLQYQDGLVRLLIKDNGAGFRPHDFCHPEGMGLPGMRERLESLGGELEINSEPGKGVTLLATLSLKEVADAVS